MEKQEIDGRKIVFETSVETVQLLFYHSRTKAFMIMRSSEESSQIQILTFMARSPYTL